MSVLALGLQNGPGRRASLGWDERNFLSLAMPNCEILFMTMHDNGGENKGILR